MTGEIRALPLWQPWASLVVHGAKKIETRSWPCPPSLIGQRIAIHATKTRSQLGVAHRRPFKRILRELHEQGDLAARNPNELPLGALIGTVIVTGCEQMTDESCWQLEANDPVEHALGLYQPGRYAWQLAEPVAFHEPIPWRGAQGIFIVPADVVGVPPLQGALL